MDCKLRVKNCGGCPLLGLDYAEQLKQKEEKVRALVGKYGPVHPIRGMEQPYHYRNKVISTFATGWGGKLTSGIYAANSHKVLPVESCLLQDEVLDKTMQAVRAAANACRYQPYDEDKGTGLLRQEYIDPVVAASPQEAFYAPKKSLPLRETEGMVCSEFVMCYPPGIPILAPGERITKEILNYIEYAKAKGCSMTGPEDPDILHLNVLA